MIEADDGRADDGNGRVFEAFDPQKRRSTATNDDGDDDRTIDDGDDDEGDGDRGGGGDGDRGGG